MLGVGEQLPEFHLKALVSGPINKDLDKNFTEINNESYRGKWLVLFFYPKDFTFVCPTEIKGFSDMNKDFQDRDAHILTASVDSEFVHLNWKKHEADLKDLNFPMLSDIKRELSASLGILDVKEGVSQRATFIVDPEGIIRFVYVTDLSVGRSPKEVLRILDALQTDELCPCNWEKGQKTL